MRKLRSCWLPSSVIAPVTAKTCPAMSAACSALTSGGCVSAVANIAMSVPPPLRGALEVSMTRTAYKASGGAPYVPEPGPLREDEAAEERVELLGRARQLLGGGGDLLGGCRRLLRRRRDLLGRGGRLLRDARDLAGDRDDLVDPGADVLDGGADVVEGAARRLDDGDRLLGAVRALLDDRDGAVRLGLHLADQAGDLLGGLLGLLGQLAHLLGDDGEAAALLAGAGGLDG